MAVFCCAALLSRRISWHFTDVDKIVVGTVAFYFFVTLFCAAIKAENAANVGIVTNNFWLLICLALLPIFKIQVRVNWFDFIAIAFAVSAIFLALLMLANRQFHFMPVQLFTGNALILSFFAGLLFVFCLMYFLFWDRLPVLFLAGILCSATAMILMSERGPILAAIGAGALLIVFGAKQNFRKILAFVVIAIIAGMLFGFYSDAWHGIFAKFLVVFERLQDPFNTDIADRSVYARLVMYRDGWEAFKAAPIFGHGRQNIIAAINGFGVSGAVTGNYSHLHNALITEAVSSGIFGIVGLLGMYFLPILVSWRGELIVRLMGVSFAVYFVLYSSTNIGFYYDVTVFFYMFMLAVLNALASAPQPNRTR